MPVGRVFNAAQNQVLISPVTSYYQGKAIRQQLEAGETDIDYKKTLTEKYRQEIDDAPSRKLAANKKAAADYDLVLENVRAKKLANEGAEMDAARDIVGPWIAEYNEKGIEWANENFNDLVLSRLPENKRAEFAEAAGPDKVFDEDEMARTGLMIAVNEVDNDPDPTSHQKHLQSLVDQGYMTKGRMNEILESIEVKAGTITGTTEYDPSGDPRTDSQAGAAYQEHIDTFNTSSDVQEIIANLLPKVTAIPDAVGFSGKLALGGAGVLSSLGQDELAAAFAENVAGADAETIAALQTQLQVLRGRIIPIVTGEQGKRLSETEREIASRAVGLIEQIKGPADLAKAYPQVIGAMKQLYEESWVTKYKTAKSDKDIQYPYDLNARDDVVELFAEFSEAGIDLESSSRAITRLRVIQGSK